MCNANQLYREIRWTLMAFEFHWQHVDTLPNTYMRKLHIMFDTLVYTCFCFTVQFFGGMIALPCHFVFFHYLFII